MQNLRTLIFGHFRLKAMSLMIAAVIWVVSTGRDYTTITPTVFLLIDPPKQGWILAINGPDPLKQTVPAPVSSDSGTKAVTFSVELYGPQNKIAQLTGALTARWSFADLRVDDIPPGQVKTEKVDLRSIKIQGLPPGVEIRKAEPESIEVKIDKMTTKQLPVQSRIVFYDTKDGQLKPVAKETSDGCVEGYQIIDSAPSPPRVFVRGPQTILAGMSKVETEPALLGYLSGGRTRKDVPAVSFIEDTIYGRVPIQCKDEITINIDVDELVKTRVIKDVELATTAPIKFLYIVNILAVDGTERSKVDIEVKGPGTSVMELKAKDVRAALDLTNVTNPGIFETPLTISLPQGIRLAGTAPVVKYEVKPIERSE